MHTKTRIKLRYIRIRIRPLPQQPIINVWSCPQSRRPLCTVRQWRCLIIVAELVDSDYEALFRRITANNPTNYCISCFLNDRPQYIHNLRQIRHDRVLALKQRRLHNNNLP